MNYTKTTFILCLMISCAIPATKSSQDTSFSYLEERLLDAIRNKKLDLVGSLIKKGANVNSKSEDGETPLQVAAKRKCIEIARLLIENGADVNFQGRPGETALIEAVTNDSFEMVKLLLEKGANDQKDKLLQESVHQILLYRRGNKREQQKMIAYLLDNGADPNTIDLVYYKSHLPSPLSDSHKTTIGTFYLRHYAKTIVVGFTRKESQKAGFDYVPKDCLGVILKHTYGNPKPLKEKKLKSMKSILPLTSAILIQFFK